MGYWTNISSSQHLLKGTITRVIQDISITGLHAEDHGVALSKLNSISRTEIRNRFHDATGAWIKVRNISTATIETGRKYEQTVEIEIEEASPIAWVVAAPILADIITLALIAVIAYLIYSSINVVAETFQIFTEDVPPFTKNLVTIAMISFAIIVLILIIRR